MSLHDDYAGFLAKFEPKRTTDDCYTPPPTSMTPSAGGRVRNTA